MSIQTSHNIIKLTSTKSNWMQISKNALMKILNILSNVISEQKRYKLEPETYTKLLELTDKLWAMRNKPFNKMTLIDKIQFKSIGFNKNS